MTPQEYFNAWWKCIDEKQLGNIMSKLRVLYKTELVCPKFSDVFKAFSLCPYNELKVVIIGQDPYPQKDIATGLAFANEKTNTSISPSLQILMNCFDNTEGFDISLEHWAKQGVLLLNSSLTVRLGQPGSHSNMWWPFITSFLKKLGEWQTGIIYVLMGEHAQTFKPFIAPFNDVIEVKHPAYYARTGEKMPNIFDQIDKLTMSKNNLKIRWV